MTVAAAEAAVGLAIIIAHLPPPADGEPREHQPPQRLMLLSRQCRDGAARTRSRARSPSGSGSCRCCRCSASCQRRCCRCVPATHIGPADPAARTARRTTTAHAHDGHGGARRRPSSVRGTATPASSSLVGPAVLVLVVRARARDLLRACAASHARQPFVQTLLRVDAGRRPADRRGAPARSALDGDDAGRHRRRLR